MVAARKGRAGPTPGPGRLDEGVWHLLSATVAGPSPQEASASAQSAKGPERHP